MIFPCNCFCFINIVITVCADPAYPLSDWLLTSFTGDCGPAKDAYNFFQSYVYIQSSHMHACLSTSLNPLTHANTYKLFLTRQLRITIERSFGILVAKWGIFWQPLQFNADHCVDICCVSSFISCVHSSSSFTGQGSTAARTRLISSLRPARVPIPAPRNVISALTYFIFIY